MIELLSKKLKGAKKNLIKIDKIEVSDCNINDFNSIILYKTGKDIFLSDSKNKFKFLRSPCYICMGLNVTVFIPWCSVIHCIKLTPTLSNALNDLVDNSSNFMRVPKSDTVWLKTILPFTYLGVKPLYYDLLGQEIVAVRDKIPARYKQVDGVIYRGIRLSQKSLNNILDGKQVKLKPRKFTSWTTDKEIATSFIDREGGVLLSLVPKTKDVVVNLSKIEKYWLESEKEVILKGNGIDIVSQKNIDELYSLE